MEKQIEEQEKQIKNTRFVLDKEIKKAKVERITDWIIGFSFIYLLICGVAMNFIWAIWIFNSVFD